MLSEWTLNQLLQKVKRREEELDVLIGIGKALTSSLDHA
jgi:hypothetical protein